MFNISHSRWYLLSLIMLSISTSAQAGIVTTYPWCVKGNTLFVCTLTQTVLISNTAGTSPISGQGIDIVFSGARLSFTGTNYGVSGATNSPAFTGYAARGSFASPAAVQAGDLLASFRGSGYNGAGFVTAARGAFRVYAGETWTLTHNGTYDSFFATTNGSTTNLEFMRLYGSGGLALGNPLPADPGANNLKVLGNLSAANVIGNSGTFQYGKGTSSTGDCAAFDSGGNIVDAGVGGCTGSSGGSTAFSALTTATNSTAAMVVGTGASLGYSGSGSVNASEFQGISSVQGNGTLVQLSTGATTTNHCVKFDANGNTVDAGSACGTGTPGLVQLGQVVTTGSATSVTFSSISGSYTNLVVTYTARSTAAVSTVGLNIEFNSDSTSGDYTSTQYVLANSTTVAAGLAGVQFVNNIPGSSATASEPAVGRIWINSYAGTTFYKKFHHQGDYAQSGVGDVVVSSGGMWLSTAAVTRLDFTLGGTDAFVNGSTFTLYGEL